MFNGGTGAVKRPMSVFVQKLEWRTARCFSTEKFPSYVGCTLKKMPHVNLFSD